METDFTFDWRGIMRSRRGGLEPIILCLLKEQPMHGYEIIRTLEERSHGFWRPSAGSVYPILQLLEDQGYVSSSEKDGKKVYSITKEGLAHAANHRPPMPWEGHDKHMPFRELKELMPSIIKLKMAVKKIMIVGSKEDQAAVSTIIKKAANEIETIAQKLDSK